MNDPVFPGDPAAPPRRGRAWLLVPLLAFAGGAVAVKAWLASAHQPAPAAAVAAAPAPTTAVAPAVPSPAAAPAQEPARAPVVPTGPAAAVAATVDGHPVTLRDIEDALLRKEGVEQVEEAVHSLVERTDWGRLGDDDLIVVTAAGRVKRLEAVAGLRDRAEKAREDLVDIAAVDQALAKEGVVVDQAAIDAEVARTEKRLREALERRKQPLMDLDTVIQQSEKMPLSRYVKQPRFRMLTGLHILVQRHARREVADAELQRFFAEHLDRYAMPEAVDLSDIPVPYETVKDEAGRETVAEEEKVKRQEVARFIYEAIRKGQVGFGKSFALFGASRDQDAGPDGRVGWVARDGERGKRGARRIPVEVVAEAFKVQPPYPVLLPPVAHEQGVDIVTVHGHRAGQEPALALMRDRVLTDLVDSEIEARTKRLMDGLRQAAAISYSGDLAARLDARLGTAGAPGGAGAVATVNGVAVTLREVEDAVLRKDGAGWVEGRVHALLEGIDWATLGDDDLVVASAFGKLTRFGLVAPLLREQAGTARKDLISIVLVEQALAKEGVKVDQAAIEAFIQSGKLSQQDEKMPRDRLVRQPGFRLLVGTRILMQRRARQEVGDAELQKFLDAHADRYRVREGVDLSDIFVPFQPAMGADERATLRQLAVRLYDAMHQGQVSFERTVAAGGRSPGADADGRLGWVGRDGSCGRRGARVIPAKVVEEAFAAQPPFPALLPPIVHEHGIDIVRVHARRAGQEPTLALVRDRVLADLVDAETDQRSERLLNQLRRAAVIEYASLAELVEARAPAPPSVAEPGAAGPGAVPKPGG